MLNNRILFTLIAVFLVIFGLSLLFLPAELQRVKDFATINVLNFQLLGGVLLALAYLNFRGRKLAYSFEFSRAILSVNLIHFLIGSILLLKFKITTPDLGQDLIYILAFYFVFALLTAVNLIFKK